MEIRFVPNKLLRSYLTNKKQLSVSVRSFQNFSVSQLPSYNFDLNMHSKYY